MAACEGLPGPSPDLERRPRAAQSRQGIARYMPMGNSVDAIFAVDRSDLRVRVGPRRNTEARRHEQRAQGRARGFADTIDCHDRPPTWTQS